MPRRPSIARRRSSAVVAVLAIGVLAAALAGCGSAEPSTSTAPSGVEEPAGPSLGLTSNLAEFEGELRDATTRQGSLIRDLSTASVGTPVDMRRVIAAMRDWVDRERAWLADHPSEPCYDAAATRFEAALDAMADAAAGFETVTTASPVPSGDAAFAPAMEFIQTTSRALLDAAANARVNRPNCR